MTTHRVPSREKIVEWLQETEPGRLEELWKEADRTRQEFVGDEVHVRGLLEISNYCDRSCHYCGLRVENDQPSRYRMTLEEIRTAAQQAIECRYGTLVMQSGEDPGLDIDQLCQIIKRIKEDTDLAVTLSLGERSDDELLALRQAGADRYLLRFETSNQQLLNRIHPLRPGQRPNIRFELLARLREFGYELGSGVMIGIPGQTINDLANDLLLFRELDLDMIGVGPFIPHPQTPLAHVASDASPVSRQVSADAVTTYKVLALSRLVCPLANIPSTTALATLGGSGARMLGLQRGANVIMPNLTPARYRQDYNIYPDKAGSRESQSESAELARQQISALGRIWGQGRGDSRNRLTRLRDTE